MEPFDDELTNAIRYYYSEIEPADDGNYWYYDKDGNIVVWEWNNRVVC